MSTDLDAASDSRSVDELVSASLSETDEEIAWNAVCVLHWKGSAEVMRRAQSLCTSQCSQERILGANILGQLGVPDRTFPSECSKQLRDMLRNEVDDKVLQAVLIGLSHQNDAEAVPLIANYRTHADPEVRHAAVLALAGHEAPLAIDSLIFLTNDPDSHVRDWATFALGTQIDLDTPAIRNALACRLRDSDDNARGEALIGLASRKDERVVPALKKELSSDCVGSLAVEAAELIASDELHSHLIALRKWWDVDQVILERAIAASQI